MNRRAARSPVAWLGALLVVYLLVPIGAFLVRLSHDRKTGFSTPGLWPALRTSAEAATIATLVIVVVGVPLAHGLARSTGRTARLIGVACQLPLALPPLMSGILLIYLVGPYTTVGKWFGGRLTGSLAGVVLAQSFVSAPFLLVAARSAFTTVPSDLDDVAATLGHGRLARFARVDLVIAAPGIGAGMLLTWLRAFGEYGATVILAYHPYTLPVYLDVQFAASGLTSTDAPTALALALAAVALGLAAVRLPRRRGRAPRLPEAVPPPPSPPTAVAFDLDVTVGTFHLRVAHEARSPRLAILGPSGSGKSMTLRSLAGLLGPEVGAVRFAGRDVGRARAERRGVGYVPQGADLLPGRTLWAQVLFATGARPGLAAWWVTALRLEDLEGRRPEELSGGQRQRVGLARALARHPDLLLLDEPFSALDAPVRSELRGQLRRLQREAGLSSVIVTHDPEEAALLADEVLVIEGGRLLQAGPLPEVYARPASPEVARLVGVVNLNRARVVGLGRIDSGGVTIALPTPEDAADVLWSVRPEHVEVGAPGRAGTQPGTLLDVVDLGGLWRLIVELAPGVELEARTTEAPSPDRPGAPVSVRIPADRATVWAAALPPQVG